VATERTEGALGTFETSQPVATDRYHGEYREVLVAGA